MTSDWSVETVHYAVGIAESRKDCIVFVSANDDGVPFLDKTTAVTDVQTFRDITLNVNSSYAFLDSGYKYQFDGYNQKYRWIPLNADIAGLCARTDFTNDPWFSPGGFSRGQIKNVVRLAYSPDETARDLLYMQNVNPVVSFRGEGTILYGDKTLQNTPNSSFDRINVRRLFITLQKAIAKAAKSQLFEFNDEFTRAQFKSIVEPFLRDVQGRRGITDFLVVCDETNNTGEVIDSNRFVADIYIKPARSINFITLNFIATKTGVAFSEVICQ
jgi:phage tail sheath protein FI